MTAAPSLTVLGFLLGAGAPINGSTARGDTCLHYAVMAGHEEAVRFLLHSVRILADLFDRFRWSLVSKLWHRIGSYADEFDRAQTPASAASQAHPQSSPSPGPP